MKLKITGILCVIAGFLLTPGANAQDIHFTQYRQSPLTLNPAHTGAIFGDLRLAANFRSQWRAVLDSPFRTASLSFDKPFFIKDDRIGFGLYVVSDQAGDVGYSTTKLAASGSYIKLIGYQEIRVGMQVGYTIRSIDNNITFPEDYNRLTGQFDPTIGQAEPLAKLSSGYLDINLGLSWMGNFDKFRPEAGIAAFHLNGPKETFFANSQKIGVRTVGHLSLKTFLTRKFFVDPNFLIMSQTGAKNFIAGVNGGMKLQPNNARLNSFFMGVAVRNGFSENPDAAIIQGGASISNFDIGLSYDVNLSSLRVGVSGNGSFEVSLIYTAPSSRLIKTKIDSERL